MTSSAASSRALGGSERRDRWTVSVGQLGPGDCLLEHRLSDMFASTAGREAASEAFADNAASNRISRALGYEPNGTAWATGKATRRPTAVSQPGRRFSSAG